uniref:plasmid mobilization protein n=1 Tax=Pigmentiphaga litoralis TaxID=516702 RepID=UPI00389A9631
MGEAKTVRRLGKSRRDNEKGGRTEYIKVWCSPEEKAAVVVKAEQQGVTAPRLLFESAMAQPGRLLSTAATSRRSCSGSGPFSGLFRTT